MYIIYIYDKTFICIFRLSVLPNQVTSSLARPVDLCLLDRAEKNFPGKSMQIWLLCLNLIGLGNIEREIVVVGCLLSGYILFLSEVYHALAEGWGASVSGVSDKWRLRDDWKRCSSRLLVDLLKRLLMDWATPLGRSTLPRNTPLWTGKNKRTLC